MTCAFNVYDLNWTYVDTFWSCSDWGLKEPGDFRRDMSRCRYNGPVYIKRLQ